MIATATTPSIDKSFTLPEASRLDRLDSIVFTIAEAGTATPGTIADKHNMVSRMGTYYADALCYLGLAVAVTTGISPRGRSRSYALSASGKDYVSRSVAERQEILRGVIDSYDLANYVRNYGTGTAVDFVVSNVGGSMVTAEKKVASVRSWIRQMYSKNFLNEHVVTNVAPVVGTVESFDNWTGGRENLKASVGNAQELNICTTCYLEMPLTGTCSTCDED